MNPMIQGMRGFSIRLRMLGAIAVVLVLLAGVGGAGLYGMFRVQALGQHIAEDVVGQAQLLGDLRTAMGNLRRFEKDMVINYEQPDKVVGYRDQWRAELTQAKGLIAQLKRSASSEQQAVLAGLDKNLLAYAEASEPVIRQLEANGYDTATVANRMLGRAKEPIRASEDQMAALSKMIRADGEAAQTASTRAARDTQWLFGGALALAALVVVPFTLANMVSICRPLDSARRLAETIAQGDLSSRVEVQGRDETAALQRSLLAMQQSLAGLVGQVRTSAESIGAASAEVASGNSDLSNRTEQTASSLQQTASAMGQITGSVQNGAASALEARALADTARQVAQRGGAAAAQVVATMGEIDRSSRKIADIIGTIDGIAFQTNILALNAAVEAARAGEQGRGFAVVASEVRSLAQRSATAAREIKGLIQASVEKVESGTRQVQDAGSTMAEIVASVQRVSDTIAGISAAAAEQSSGIGQVNQSVSQLDQSTQQNAALVEQSAAAAESLKEQAARLADVVAAFRLEPTAH